jgi:hypothetical protein
MKVNVNVTLDDTQRRKVRAAGFGLKGKASRAEVRVWVNELMKKSLDSVPEPKVRRKTQAPPELLKAVAEELDGMAQCSACHKSLFKHQGAKRHCPLSRTVKPGSTFKGR